MLNIYANNSEPENTTEQIASFGDYTPEEYENITEGSNSSESVDILQRVRTLSIETYTTGPEQRPPTGKTLSVSCANPKATCVLVRCNLKGPIGNNSKVSVFFNMSANFEVLGKSSFS
jgi:hypothetical protein